MRETACTALYSGTPGLRHLSTLYSEQAVPHFMKNRLRSICGYSKLLLPLVDSLLKIVMRIHLRDSPGEPAARLRVEGVGNLKC